MDKNASDVSQEITIDTNEHHETFLILSTEDNPTGRPEIQETSAQCTSTVHLESDASSNVEDTESVQCIDNTIVVSRALPSDANIYGRLYLAEHGSQVIFYNTVPPDCTTEPVCTDKGVQISDITEEHQDNTLKKPRSSNTRNTTRYNSSGERTFVCPAEGCGRHFSSSGHLKYHQSTHSGEKPFKCPQPGCEKVFAWPAHLKYHIKTHSGDRPYKCEFEGCGKSFYVLQRLNVHLRIHTGERPFTCEINNCNKSFSTAGNLKNHMRIHTGERPYVCPFVTCGKSFTEHSSLRKHKLRHTGEKPYSCEICGKSFSQSGSRNAHEKRHLLDKLPAYTKSPLTMEQKDSDMEQEEEESLESGDQETTLPYIAEKSNNPDHIVLAQPIIAKEVSIETTPVAEELVSNHQNDLSETSTCVVSLAETVVAQQVLLQSMLDGTAVIPVTQAEPSDDLTVVDHVLEHQDVEQIMQSVVSQHIVNGNIQLPIGSDVTVSNEQGTLSFIAHSADSQNIMLNHESEQDVNTLSGDGKTVIVQSEENVDS